MKELIKPKKLLKGDKIGIFTPSTPANVFFREKYLRGISYLEKIGFEVVEGELTKSLQIEGYRTAPAKERAAEFMELIEDTSIKALISTIGGFNSSSLIPYLDFKKIRESQKVICGFSDVTSLHLAILAYSRLSTFYGPAIMPSFGEYPEPPAYTMEGFLRAASETDNYPVKIEPPQLWSNHFLDATNDDWKMQPREYQKNLGWQVLNEGEVKGKIIIANLNTLMSNAGTKHFPDFQGKVLLIETMSGNMGSEERLWRHLDLLGIFDQITGLLVGKFENLNMLNAPFSHADLILEIVGKRDYPIISEFDCSHTIPMLTLSQLSEVHIKASKPQNVEFNILSAMVED